MAQKHNLITVEVAYASCDQQILLTVQVPEGATIQDVIRQSGLLQLFPEIDLTQQSVGIFSQKKSLSDTVQSGDRVEIYRPLLLDPMDARRLRANA